LSPDPFPRLGDLLLVEKEVFTKEEFLEMVKAVDQETN